jgi:hypothetical protein
MRPLALHLTLLLGSACAPTVDDDGADDDASSDPPTLTCADPQEPGPGVASCGLHLGLFEGENWSSFATPDGETQALIVRRWEAQGAGHSAIYSLQAFAIQKDGCLLCIADAALLSYDSSHHNWIDVAWAQLTDQQLRFETRFQPADDPLTQWIWTFPLSGHELGEGGALLWGPLLLEPLDGLQPPA